MKKQRCAYIALGLLGAFVLWTVAIGLIDVKAIGPQASCVGFAALNRFVHDLTGVHMVLYTVTDWLGLVPIGVATGFGVLGLAQWFRRKRLRNVDADILVLGGFYIVIMAVYALFEVWVINYRPVLIGGVLEASYPSSTTMLVMTVMPTAVMQAKRRIKSAIYRWIVVALIVAFVSFMVIGRLVSGVHWFTDIVGGVLLGAGFVLLYASLVKY